MFADNLLPAQLPELLSFSAISHQLLVKLKPLSEIIEDHPLNSTDVEQESEHFWLPNPIFHPRVIQCKMHILPGLPNYKSAIMRAYKIGLWGVMLACASLSMVTGCQRNISGSYLASDNSAVLWLQVVRTPDNHLTGQLPWSRPLLP